MKHSVLKNKTVPRLLRNSTHVTDTDDQTVQNTPPLTPLPNYTHTQYISSQSISVRSTVTLTMRSFLYLHSVLLPSRLMTTILYEFNSFMHITFPVCLVLPQPITLIISGAQSKLRSYE